MTKGVKKHPPKKKKLNRPRPEPVVPLTDDERRLFALKEFAKAEMHLKEAEILSKAAATPNACAHSAYYSMYHCAAAFILSAGGVGKRRSFPESHTHVIEHFGKLVADEKGAWPRLDRCLTARRLTGIRRTTILLEP